MPITDEKAPKDSDFELLIRRLWDVPLNAAFVFNCQMGRGRTTTGGRATACGSTSPAVHLDVKVGIMLHKAGAKQAATLLRVVLIQPQPPLMAGSRVQRANWELCSQDIMLLQCGASILV